MKKLEFEKANSFNYETRSSSIDIQFRHKIAFILDKTNLYLSLSISKRITEEDLEYDEIPQTLSQSLYAFFKFSNRATSLNIRNIDSLDFSIFENLTALDPSQFQHLGLNDLFNIDFTAFLMQLEELLKIEKTCHDKIINIAFMIDLTAAASRWYPHFSQELFDFLRRNKKFIPLALDFLESEKYKDKFELKDSIDLNEFKETKENKKILEFMRKIALNSKKRRI